MFFVILAFVGIAVVAADKMVPVERTFEQSSGGSSVPNAGTVTGIWKIISTLK
jgi:hypothetical protein